jgi:hypothetical protein
VSRSYFTRVVRLSNLAPDITQAILEGRPSRDLTAEKLIAHSRLPLAWRDREVIFGRFPRSFSGRVLALSAYATKIGPFVRWACKVKKISTNRG